MVNARRQRFDQLDAMRALAALSVLAYHLIYKAYVSERPGSPLADYAAHLDIGVPVFFLISGFVLYRPFVAARRAGFAEPDVDGYGLRRVARIVPAYWVALVLAGLAGATIAGFRDIFSLRGAIAYFGFLQIYQPETAQGGIDPAWSLCVEVTFYVFLPLWALLMRRIVPQRTGIARELAALAVLYAASVAFQVLAVSKTNPAGFNYSGTRWLDPLPNWLDMFAAGMALALVTTLPSPPRALAWLDRRAWPAWLLAAVLFWVLSTRIGLHAGGDTGITPLRYLMRHQLQILIAAALLAPAIIAPQSSTVLSRVLRLRPLALGGLISYGIYLFHLPVALKLAQWQGLPSSGAELAGFVAIALPVTLVIAWLSHRLIEAPAQEWARRRSARSAPDAEPVSEAPALAA